MYRKVASSRPVYYSILELFGQRLELMSKELNPLAAILYVYAGGLNFMK